MKSFLKRMILVSLILVSLLGICFSKANAQNGFDFYFFGQNLKSFENSNWLKVAVGATASLFFHELGHALALELAGKSWDFKTSFPSGFAVHTDEYLDAGEYLNLGRAGFAVQSFIGFVLTSFEITRSSDYTKGWVSMNAFQIHTYRGRSHDIGDDFAMIDKGGANGDLEFAAFSLLSVNNLLRLESDPWTLMTKSFYTPPLESDNIIESIDNANEVLIVAADLDLPKHFLPKVELSRHNPQDAFDQPGLHWGDTLLARSQQYDSSPFRFHHKAGPLIF
jgi:hypothetical protein